MREKADESKDMGRKIQEKKKKKKKHKKNKKKKQNIPRIKKDK